MDGVDSYMMSKIARLRGYDSDRCVRDCIFLGTEVATEGVVLHLSPVDSGIRLEDVNNILDVTGSEDELMEVIQAYDGGFGSNQSLVDMTTVLVPQIPPVERWSKYNTNHILP